MLESHKQARDSIALIGLFRSKFKRKEAKDTERYGCTDQAETPRQDANKCVFRFQVNLDPVGKARHRDGIVKGKNGGFKAIKYDPQKNLANFVKICLKNQAIKEKYVIPQGPIRVDLKCYMPIPASFSKKKKSLALWGVIAPDTKPDKDNIDKFIFDCGNEILWKDDKQIVDGRTQKLYDSKPRTEIIIMTENKISKEAEDILSIFEPEYMVNFLEDIHDLYNLYHLGEGTDVEFFETVAKTLSCIATRYHKQFSAINKLNQRSSDE